MQVGKQKYTRSKAIDVSRFWNNIFGVRPWNGGLSLGGIAFLGAHLIALLICVQSFPQTVDTIAYMQVARHYLEGKPDLAINGYWGPLQSWLSALIQILGVSSEDALRLVLICSSELFVFAGIGLTSTLGAARREARFAILAICLFSLYWTRYLSSPDMLLAGLLVLSVVLLLGSPLAVRPRPFAGGAVLGLAYLAKAAGLPIGVLLLVTCLAIRLAVDRAPVRRAVREFIIAGVVFAAISGTWIGIISEHYGTLTISKSAAINHAVMGPSNVAGGHPSLSTFNVPRAGRLTSWEDPAEMQYPYWSITDGKAAFNQQIQVILSNLSALPQRVSGPDILQLGLASSVISTLVYLCRLGKRRSPRWPFTVAFVIAMSVVYLPVYAAHPRYYLATFPFLIICLLQTSHRLISALPITWRRNNTVGTAVNACLVAIICLPLLAKLLIDSPRGDGEILGDRLASAFVSNKLPKGPIAGIGGFWWGMQVAAKVDVPYLGTEVGPAAYCAATHIGARYVLSNRLPAVPDGMDAPALVASVTSRNGNRALLFEVKDRCPRVITPPMAKASPNRATDNTFSMKDLFGLSPD